MDFESLSTHLPKNNILLERKTPETSNHTLSSAQNSVKDPYQRLAEKPSKKRRLNLCNDENNPKVSQKSLENFNVSHLFQDTFTGFDDTQALIDRSNNLPTNHKDVVTFTQICNNSQVLRQIDNDINRSNQKQEKKIKINEDVPVIRALDFDSDFTLTGNNLPISSSKPINDKSLRSILEKKDKTNFKDDTQKENVFTTSQYRKGVEKFFEKVECSIREPGSNQDNIFAKEANMNSVEPLQAKLDEDIDSLINWDGESFLAVLSPEHNEEVGNAMKKALLENAKKAVSPAKVMNQTLAPTEPTYRELGDFYGLPSKVKELIKMYRGIEKLYDWQDECLNLPGVKEKKNLVYALPTSGGKTLVAEILILREILCWKRNALFILPYVAIVQEKVWGLSPFAVALDFLIEEYAAGKGNYPPRKRRRKNSIYIATIEKGLGLVNSLIDTGRIEELGLVIVDELHLLGDQSRGSTLEELLNKLLCLQENIQIIGMSATIGNLPEICDFLNAEQYTQNFRPVELIEYVKCGDELARINWQAKDENDLFAVERKCDFSYSAKLNKIDPDCLAGLVMEVIPNESCLIFCSSKKNCENVAALLCRVIPVSLTKIRNEEKENLKHSLAEETGNLCNILKTSILFGIAYHHSGLTSDERRLIEEGFRAGILNVICCTSTLAAGVNLPAKRVILRQPYVGREFINLSKYKQMVGRAGRAGLGSSGESILICTQQDLPKVRGLLLSPMDQALSSLHQNGAVGLRQLLLSCISLNIATTRADLHKMAKRTLLAVQESRLDVALRKITDKAIIELFKLGALKIDSEEESSSSADISVLMDCSNSTILTSSSGDSSESKPKLHISLNNRSKLVISKLGSAAIKAGLELTRAHLLYEDLLQAQASLVLLDCLHLLYLVTPYDISEQVKPSKPRYYKIYTQLGKKELQTARILGLTESCAIRLLNNQPIKNVSERVLNRFYVTLMLLELWNGATIFQVAEKFELPRGLIQNLMTSAASFASNVVNFCTELEEFWSFAYLLRGMTERLQHCCVKELLPLMELPSVKQSRAKQLYNAGYKSLSAIAKANPNDLVENIEYMSRKVANQLIAAAKLLLLERVENLREEAEDVMNGIEPKSVNQRIAK